MKTQDIINAGKPRSHMLEGWSQKYKNSINCSHPKGFSQRAHCAGKTKQNESVEIEMVCEDCGMCQTHGHINEIKKGAKDSNGYTRCWPGKHAEGTKKGKNGGQVRNCVPNESVAESSQRVDSLVTDALKIMRGSEASDAVAALKTVLGDREYNSRRGFYNFYVRQILDMSGQQGMAEGSRKAWMKHNDLVDLEKPLAGLKAEFNNLLRTHDPEEKAKYQQGIKQRIKNQPMAGPKGQLPEDFNGEYDDEAGMAQGNLYTIAQAAQGLLDTIDDRDNLPEWAQEKIAKVEGMLVTVWNYLQSQKAQGIDPEIDEGEVKPFVIPDDQTQGNYENQGYRKSPQDRFAVIDYTFNKLILTTNDIKQAKQEAIEWAEYDDIPVAVKNQQTNKVVFKLNGYADAEKYLDESVDREIVEMYEAMQNLVSEMAQTTNVSEDTVWETFEALDDNVLYETAAWRRKEGKSKSGGLNAKGVASYRRENPGSKLQTAVTTKPSKLKPGSKAAKRRKSFCARMSGVKGPMKKPNGKPTRKALALRKWNC